MRESDQHILAEHYLDLYQMAYLLLQNQAEAEDAVQEALARSFAQPFVKQPLNYCVRVLRNYCLDRLNAEYVTSDTMDTMASPEEEPLQRLMHARLQVLEEARVCLPQRTNEMLDMHFAQGLSLPEVAERSGVSLGTVRKLFKKAYRQMRKKIVMADITVKQ